MRIVSDYTILYTIIKGVECKSRRVGVKRWQVDSKSFIEVPEVV